MKKDRKNDRELLLKVGLGYLKPLKYTEFKCPICGGIATVSRFNQVTTAECYACDTRAWKG